VRNIAGYRINEFFGKGKLLYRYVKTDPLFPESTPVLSSAHFS